ncbi:hypothetical protein NEMBOFW57_002108 [Staphylotrichum longicolle]|uniref:DNA-(apurinic or apyrimidinic site) lyase n=1 Tax=Staphylotrichum longicolle TaxID=669026 RepID=A0AAD4F2F8_9PEZI|nr:hypothetical protein NEMBOFW57_002108 [Staphylotrichum longicolle]
MGAAKAADWRKLPLSLTELSIDTTLRCGQSFRWRKIRDEWHCVLRGRLVSLKQDSSHLHYHVTWPKTATNIITPPASVPPSSPSPPEAKDAEAQDDDTASLLHNYFALSLSLSALYKQWAASDANFARRAPAFTGIRILNQDAWEALVAFICSSNNNISRISQMVHKLCLHYGPYVATVHGEPFHDFPTPQALSGPQVETHLRQLGFGYRARYIAETALIISAQHSPDWLLGLRNPASPAFGTTNTTASKAHTTTKPSDPSPNTPDPNPKDPPTYRTAHTSLLTLPGVGPKVADCVCLMGLGWGEAVPVDTHVWQIAQRDYRFGAKTKTKTFTKAMYDAVGDHFRGIWGPQAGWAQSVLFTANLREFAGQAAGAGAAAAAAGNVAQEGGRDGDVAKAEGEGEGIGALVKVEGPDEVSRPADSRVVLKVEETVELVTGRALKKRKTRASLRASVDSGTTEQVTVKIEEKQESVTGRTTRTRKPSASTQVSAADGKSEETGRVAVQARRTSKRVKVTGR